MSNLKVGDKVFLIRPFTDSVHSLHLRTSETKFQVTAASGNMVDVKAKGHDTNQGCYADRFKLVNTYPNPPRSHVKERIAHAEGADIECRDGGPWGECFNPNKPAWSDDVEYRVKPAETPEQLEAKQIESKMRKLAKKTTKLADRLKALNL